MSSAAARSPTKIETLLVGCLFVATLSIFVNIGIGGTGGRLRPFDLLMVLAGPALLLFSPRPLRASAGLWIILASLMWSAANAFKVDSVNGLRETIQACELCLFAVLLVRYINYIDWYKIGIYFLYFGLALTIVNIGWHLSHGYYVGWKQLNEPKFMFTFGQIVLFIYLYLRNRPLSPLEGAGVVLMLGLLVQSGERKALIYCVICCALMLATGRIRIVWLVAFLPIAVVVMGVAAASNDYVDRQLNSIYSGITTQGPPRQSLEDFVVEEGSDDTLSNAQRAFSKYVSAQLDEKYFWTGIGTNGYLNYVVGEYYDLPQYLTLGIHNEFQRERTETGIIGYLIYIAAWIRTVTFILSRFLIGTRSARRQAMVGLIAFIGLWFQCRYESSGNHAALSYIFMALLPEMISSQQWRARVVERVRRMPDLGRNAWRGAPIQA